MRRSLVIACSALFGSLLCSMAGMAATPAPYFEGKTITLITGYRPGGGVDASTRLIAQFLPKYIPGTPKVVVRNMPGGDGVVAVNFLANKAAADGLTLSVPGHNWFLGQLLKDPGVQFDPAKLQYLGSTGPDSHLLWLRKQVGVTDAGKLKALRTKIRIGGLSPRSETIIVPKLLAGDGFPFTVVAGYESTGNLLIALEQGEVDGAYVPRSSIEGRRKDLVDSGALIAVAAMVPAADHQLPLVTSFLSAKPAAVVNGISSLADRFGLMLVGPDGIPQDRVRILRDAFTAMSADPAYRKGAAAMSSPYTSPIVGTTLQTEVPKALASVPQEALDAHFSLHD